MVLQPFKLKMYKYFKWKVKNILNTCLILKFFWRISIDFIKLRILPILFYRDRIQESN